MKKKRKSVLFAENTDFLFFLPHCKKMYTIYVVKFSISFNKIFLQYFFFYQEVFPVKINLENFDIKYKQQTY